MAIPDRKTSTVNPTKKQTTISKAKKAAKDATFEIVTGTLSGAPAVAGKAYDTLKEINKKNNEPMYEYENKVEEYNKNIADSIKGSTRLFGAPHQFLPHVDPRIGANKGVRGLGQLYAEKIITEAPIVYIKPGKSKFMPGQNSRDKEGMLSALTSAVAGDFSELETLIQGEDPSEDLIRYFGFQEDFSDYMSKVNLLCRFMALFLGIADERVPWALNISFGHYDWRYYKFSKVMSTKNEQSGASGNWIGNFIRDVFDTAEKAISEDDMYMTFYVDGSASFSESASNSTSSSMIKQFTDRVSSMAKELQTVSGVSGLDASGLAGSIGSSLDEWSKSLSGDGALNTFMKRLTSTTGQLIQGANFAVPDVWSDSDYSKSYSIPITLSTPYGNALSWYLSVGVPLCFLLGLALPHGTSANTYSAPYMIQAFCQGWFNCGLGIVDTISLDKSDWNALHLPNTIKVNLGIKDLYTQLSLPEANKATGFMKNTGIFEFLLINSGVDLTVSGMTDKWKIWSFIFQDKLTNKIQAFPYNKLIKLRNKVNTMGKLIK